MEFMRAGGWAMWALLITALFVAGWAAARPKEVRSRVLSVGCVVILMEGMLGMSTGMMAVNRQYELFPDKTAAIAGGLGDLALCGVFAAVLFTVLGIAAWVTTPRQMGG